MEKLYTVSELAQLLRCTERTVNRYIDDGKIRAIKKGQGSKTLIPESAYLEYLDRHTTGEEPEDKEII